MDYTIQELPEEERPREKLEELGAGDMTSVELLSIILRTGTQGKNVKELASEILNQHSVSELGNQGLESLKKFQGISRVKAGQLKALGELSRRAERTERESIEDLSDVRSQVGDMKFLDSEVLRVFYLNSGNELVGEEEFDGGVSNVGLDVQEIFRSAIESKASAVILAHNHPSGEASATEQDLGTTEEVIEAGENLGIDVLDHVIVGEEVFSMRSETGLW
ncbi:MAG: RadC family protein [Candidatus Nanohalobium sp.]